MQRNEIEVRGFSKDITQPISSQTQYIELKQRKPPWHRTDALMAANQSSSQFSWSHNRPLTDQLPKSPLCMSEPQGLAPMIETSMMVATGR
ncbi:MAG: hypothetical protein ACKPKO_47975, partial [Candidatus Fonsibacter sp.]